MTWLCFEQDEKENRIQGVVPGHTPASKLINQPGELIILSYKWVQIVDNQRS